VTFANDAWATVDGPGGRSTSADPAGHVFRLTTWDDVPS
jgi:hypothetical protein